MPREAKSTEEIESVREELAMAALKLYRRGGTESISFRKLADSISVSHTMPYRYFSGKQALVARMRLQALRHFHAVLGAAEGDTTHPILRARAMVHAYVDFATRHTGEYMLIFSTHQPDMKLFPDLLKARQAIFERAVSVVEECVKQDFLAGNPREIAHIIWVSVHGLLTLNGANQLVHGMTLTDLIEPIIDKMLRFPEEMMRPTTTKQ